MDYGRAHIINARPSVQDGYQRRFIADYGDDAEKALKKATGEAGRPGRLCDQNGRILEPGNN